MADRITTSVAQPVSPLRQARPSSDARQPAGITAAEIANLGYIVVRGQADDEPFMAAAAAVLGEALPVQPQAVVRCRAGVIVWQSPDEWWIACARRDRDALVRALQDALQGSFSQVVDNSGGLTALHLSGPAVLLVLRHLSPCDVEALAEGASTSTVAGKAGFTVVRTQHGATLLFRRSFAMYLWQLIDRAAGPYGLRLVPAWQLSDGLFSLLEVSGAPADADSAVASGA